MNHRIINIKLQGIKYNVNKKDINYKAYDQLNNFRFNKKGNG
jgi:hypothetical protein